MAPLVPTDLLSRLSHTADELTAASDKLSAEFVEADKALTPILTKLGVTSDVVGSLCVAFSRTSRTDLEVREIGAGYRVCLAEYRAVVDPRDEDRGPERDEDGNVIMEDSPSQVKTLTQLSRSQRLKVAEALPKFVERVIKAAAEKTTEIAGRVKELNSR
jgi:hypothetical protein